MANNYLQFAMGFQFWGDDELKLKMAEWIYERLLRPWKHKDMEFILKHHEVETDVDEEDDGDGEAYWPFSWNIETEDREHPNWFPGILRAPEGMYVYAEEAGDVDCLASVLQQFLIEFDETKKRAIEVTWAATCSKMRVGEFSGGSVIINAEQNHWFGPSQAWDLVKKLQLKTI